MIFKTYFQPWVSGQSNWYMDLNASWEHRIGDRFNKRLITDVSNFVVQTDLSGVPILSKLVSNEQWR